ncbi:hypothetical protein A2865_01505 [Candidatus Woesebacteria bacterium RIFCSPHIGHO2_01_FULL_39_17]|uniref:Inosine-5'-monophosphate dehydrogenase n=3 Tax=Candidatus Woeseibacteriota TaxID=1752722 RepID=A0A0G0NBH6_9BACT|nr:MAG: Inosine-5'-monophosphate dehydrogenase [Microgenomates group bacterium GW2011_GWC1_38_12]KKQ93572.1 MAG: Inosine-5'-monophosphate dehydrogenase [Candidatus Woesebacteria bacterium GW2011_GWB1_39_10b]KKR13519.1 MAG: Inosine-5'-monophosphate dehydrogenase [Candidatus Woesebacteria bacterium GW2011_GWA1_39_21b]OGM22874.1 MAG: hypothetical protein A2865_01505 [Candidatus Woesebacteria bacterium RIFCSPHIGHO2_01_FULL_39_17]OGM61927.1 MAG: hypothetical protein A3A52_00075 [Candidatus Woesebact
MSHDFPLALSFDDVLLIPRYSDINSRSEVDLTSQISSKLTLKNPIISTKMDTVTGVKMASTLGKLGGMGILPRFESVDSQADKVNKVKKTNVPVAAAVGVKDGFLERAQSLVNAGVDALDIDVAHGHMRKTIEATRIVKEKFGRKVTILSGIAATYECARDLYKAGADSLLVGIGASPICITRVVTGFGLPSISSLLEVAKAAKEYKKTFMPDSGIKNSGDVVKALATGASAVVCGFLLAGIDETPGKIVTRNGLKYKTYNGSTSLTEKDKHVKIDSSDKNGNYITQIEGVESLVDYKGPLAIYMENVLAGVRSGLAYAGARNIQELWKKAKFVRITSQGMRESVPHDVLLNN